MYSPPSSQFKYVGVCLLGEFQVVLSAVELPPTPFAKEFHIYAPWLGILYLVQPLLPSNLGRLTQR